jgi:hypothetical protein
MSCATATGKRAPAAITRFTGRRSEVYGWPVTTQDPEPVDPPSAQPARPKEIPLGILVADAEESAVVLLRNTLRELPGIVRVESAAEGEAAGTMLETGKFNAVFVDPLSIGLEEATAFVLKARANVPETVFVLYVDRSAAEGQREAFYRGERRRFSHYYTLDKATPSRAFAREVEAVIRTCRADLSWRLSAATLDRFLKEAEGSQSEPSPPDRKLLEEVRDALRRVAPGEKTPVRKGTVFLSFGFARQDLVDGLSDLLQESGFEIITGEAANTYVSRAVLQRIGEAEFFLSLMTRDTEKPRWDVHDEAVAVGGKGRRPRVEQAAGSHGRRGGQRLRRPRG